MLAERNATPLSGEDMWALLKLAWISKGKKNGKTSFHYEKIRESALSTLFGDKNLPPRVATAAKQPTGHVNAYGAYRKSLRGWCRKNAEPLRSIIEGAKRLGPNDGDRLDLASRIADLPRVPTPKSKRTKPASDFITPLVAYIDPKCRFPMINGAKGLKQKLAGLRLTNRGLREQVEGLMGLILQFGLRDAFEVDTMTEAEINQIGSLTSKRKVPARVIAASPNRGRGTPLPLLDDAERKAVQKSAKITYRSRHKKMTNRLRELLPGLTLSQGADPDCRYDALITNYNGNGRDLLVEAKPDPDKGSIRIAIGQLFDYRRFLPNQAATDLVILTIPPPTQSHIELMLDLQIAALWFGDEGCRIISGKGRAWSALKTHLATKR